MEGGHTMASQAEADGAKRTFKRDVSYRSLRSTTSKALSTLRRKVSELSQPSVRRRPLGQLNDSSLAGSPRAASLPRPRTTPAAPVKRSPSPEPRSPGRGQDGPAQLLRTPGGADGSSLSDFGDSPALFEYREASAAGLGRGLRSGLSGLLRRSVRQLGGRRVAGEGFSSLASTPPSAKRLLSSRRSKLTARRRIQETLSPRRLPASPAASKAQAKARRRPTAQDAASAPALLLAELNSLTTGLAALSAASPATAPGPSQPPRPTFH